MEVVLVVSSDQEVAAGIAEVLAAGSLRLSLLDHAERGGQTYPGDLVAGELTPPRRKDRLIQGHLVQDDVVAAVEHGADGGTHPGEEPLPG